MSFDVSKVRRDVPQLDVRVREKPWIYLDNGATTLKPRAVIDRVAAYYSNENSNVHRGAHFMAEAGTVSYESARKKVAEFLGAESPNQIVFTRGTTESINLVASGLSQSFQAGDEVIVSEMEHHSNIVPWQIVCQRTGATLKAVRITDRGEIDLEHLRSLLTVKTKVVAFTSCSNVLGTITNVPAVVKLAKSVGAVSVVDAAQSVTAHPMRVQEWGADFVVFSGHKLFAEFGIGALWAAGDWLDRLPPYQGGGSMIHTVSFAGTTWADAPQKFEAGTPNVGGALGLKAAIEWFETHGIADAIAHAKSLAAAARMKLSAIEGVRVYGEAPNRTSIVSFNLHGVHASDIGSILDKQGIAIRTGHHCCQPLMQRLGVTATARASFSIYNTETEVEALVAGVRKAKEILT